jgi:hypothetical protein
MKYKVVLANGESHEHLKRNWWITMVYEGWGWRTFQRPDGKYVHYQKNSIIYMETEK